MFPEPGEEDEDDEVDRNPEKVRFGDKIENDEIFNLFCCFEANVCYKQLKR